MFLKGKNQLRNIDWSKAYLWDVRFPDAPVPFNSWFPATNVEENIYTLNTKSLELYISTYEIPLSTTLFDLKITFIDDIKLTIHEWVSNWINKEILNEGRGLTPISECCKTVQIVKLDAQKSPILTSNYKVFPKDAGYFNGSSESQPLSNVIQFVIAGAGNA